MPNVGPLELLVVLIIALLVLGPKQLPEVGRSIGKGMREFRNALKEGSLDDDDEPEPDDEPDYQKEADSSPSSISSSDLV
jgi:sec-independent protein translocase protein TatA